MAYTYLFADLLTNAVLEELPLSNVSFDTKLNGIGSFTGELSLSDPGVAKKGWQAATQPGRTAVYVDRDGDLVWGGILWARPWSNKSNTPKLTLQAQESLSYMNRRRITYNYTPGSIDQLAAFRALISNAQATGVVVNGIDAGNVGITLGSEASGMLISPAFYAYEFRSVWTELQKLAQGDPSTGLGFDFAVDVSYVSGVPTKTLHLGYPRRGRPAAQTGLMFELPGNVYGYDWPETAAQMSTSLYGLGAGNGASMLQAAVANNTYVQAGYPILEDVVSAKKITALAPLQQYTAGALVSVYQPQVVGSFEVSPSSDPVFGSYIVGDEARFRLTDERFLPPAAGGAGYDNYLRIVAIAVRPPDAGKPEVITLTTGPTL